MRLPAWITAICLTTLISVGCTQHAKRPSADVTFQGNYLLYKGKKFTGILEENFEAVETIRKTAYRQGLPDGIEEEFFIDGKLASRRHYKKGKKVGVHEGWFLNGNRRFHYEFNDGQHDGEAWEWYASGKLSHYSRFEKGRLLGKKVWRETGQIYMNYVFTPTQTAGVPGTSLCYQVRE